MPTRPTTRRRLLGSAPALPLLAWPRSAPSADDAGWPSRPVRVIVPFPPGQSTDVLPRIVAEALSRRWRHGVAVENRPGGVGPPPRQIQGPRSWTVDGVRRLIELWGRNLVGAAIGGALNRSASGVYSKARRLGLPRRDRAALTRELPRDEAPTEPLAPEAPRRPRQEIRWTQALEDELAERWFALQHHRAIARDMGLSPTTVASKRTGWSCRAAIRACCSRFTIRPTKRVRRTFSADWSSADAGTAGGGSGRNAMDRIRRAKRPKAPVTVT